MRMEWIRRIEIPFALLLILLANFFYQKNLQSNQIQTFVTPPKEIKHFIFGQSMLMADLLWVRWVQNIDQCDATSKEPIKIKKVQTFPLKPCSNAWGTQMLDRITLLDPYFKSAYLLGATVTSVLLEDTDETLYQIFDRGIEHFPHDWFIPYRAAYHAMEVMKDKAKAANYLSIAGRNGAPEWVHSLASKLYTEEGAYDLGIKSLEELLEAPLEESYRKKIMQRLQELKSKKHHGT